MQWDLRELDQLPQVICGPGEYQTRSGAVVQITRISDKGNFCCYGYFADGQTDSWHWPGRFCRDIHSINDITGRLRP